FKGISKLTSCEYRDRQPIVFYGKDCFSHIGGLRSVIQCHQKWIVWISGFNAYFSSLYIVFYTCEQCPIVKDLQTDSHSPLIGENARIINARSLKVFTDIQVASWGRFR